MTVQEDTNGADAIEISEEWWSKLTAMPFISCKCNELFSVTMAIQLMLLDGKRSFLLTSDRIPHVSF